MVGAVLLRLPLLAVALDPDEGGYAYLAGRWAAGGHLYGDVWVDRPQGLLLAYRAVLLLGHHAWAIRAGAFAAGAVLATAAGAAAWAVLGRRAAIVATLVTVVVAAGARVQGYEFNGELIAAAFTTSAVATALWWRAGRGRLWMLALAGALAMCGPLVKQSGLDGVVLVAVAAAVGLPGEAVARADRMRRLLAAGGGMALPLSAALVHAAMTGWARWWFAVVGFRTDVEGGSAGGLGTRLVRLVVSLAQVSTDVGVLLVVAAIGIALVVRRRPSEWLLLVWLGAALVGFLAGAYYHRHYWVQLVAPLAVLVARTTVGLSRRWVVAVVAVVVLGPLAVLTQVALLPAGERTAAVVTDDRLIGNGQVAAWLDAHTAPGDQVYAFVASADLYFLADRSTSYRYLWYANVSAIPGEVGRLGDWLDGPTRPAWLVVYQSPAKVDPSGRLAAVLAARYQQVAVVGGFPVLRALASPPGEG